MQILIWPSPAEFYDQSKDRSSWRAWKICRESNWNNPFVVIEEWDEHFRWERGFTTPSFPESNWFYRVESSDWGWTKPILADVVRVYNTLASDLIAMCGDDIGRNWGITLALSNTLTLSRINNDDQEKAAIELFEGLWQYAKEQKIVLLEWETAFHYNCLTSPNPQASLPLDWSWTAHWINHKDMRITWEKLKAWDLLVVFEQEWFWCNWISKVRQAFELRYWPNWYKDAPREEILEALSPSKIYSLALADANGWYSDLEKQVEMHAIWHLSWWSFESKFFEPFLKGKWLSATLDDLFPITDITKKCASWLVEWGVKFWPEEMLKTWPGWQRMIVAVPNQVNADKLIKICAKNNFKAKIWWIVTETKKWWNDEIIIIHPDLDEIYK